MIYFCVPKGSAVRFELNIWCTLVTMATAAILNLLTPQKLSKFFFNPPIFVSMATAEKFVQPIPIFFGLSRSTRCGCCSLQVSSISVRRVTCYDHFCVFQFLSILAVSMATAAILKLEAQVSLYRSPDINKSS